MALSLTVLNLSWKMITITALFQTSLTSVPSTSNDLSVTITSNITNGIICYNKSIELTCRANDANISTYKWTSTTFKQAQETASITVIATADPVQYTCMVTDTDGNIGYSSVNISSNASAPILYRVNFNEDKVVFVDDHVNLTVQVNSNLSLIMRPTWSRENANLPKDSSTKNYSLGGNNFTSLIIHKADYANDGGLYYLYTSNYCGPSSTSVDLNIDKKDVKYFPSGHPVPLLSSSNNQTTVEEEMITFRCVFQGNYSPSGYGSVYWIAALHNGSKITVLDYSNFSDYRVNTQRSCPHENYACCRFTTELEIHTTLALNDAMITCITIYDSVSNYNTSTLMVIERPVLTKGPTDVISVIEYVSIHFECHFNSSLIKYLPICEWWKDGGPTSKGDEWQIAEPGFENHLICGFNITSASVGDGGNYSCYCYYNESFKEQFHFLEIKSQFGKTELQVEIQKQKSSSWELIETIVPSVVLSSMATLLVTLVIWRVVKYYRRKPVTILVDLRNDDENNEPRVNVHNDDENAHGGHNEPGDPNNNNNDESEDDTRSSISSQSAYSQHGGPPTEIQPADSTSVLTNTGTSEGSVNFPAQQGGDGHSTTVETLNYPVSALAGSIQIGDTIDLAANTVKITNQPKDQIIQFKNNKEETINLTCYAESFEENDLCYEWYCDSSSNTILSDKHCAEIKFKRPPVNMEKRYYCKVSIANQPEQYVTSRKAVIKLEIIWFTKQPESTIAFAGKKLELSCIAATAQGMEVKYKWFKCSKTGTNKSRTDHIESRMIVPKCDDSNDHHYLCEATAIKRGTVRERIDSEVARVKVVNPVNITIIKEPPPEVFVTFGESLILKCIALCGQHPVKYQWYNDEKPLEDATQSTLTITSVSENDVGSYYCKVTSKYSEDTVESKIAEVRMKHDGSWNESQRSQVKAEELLMDKDRIYAKDKMALLIGNSTYKGKPLRCSKNDVRVVAEKLRQLNFKTIVLVDLTLSQMTNAVDYFCSLLKLGMYGVFYYSGHGVEVNKTTYFVPIDADDEELKIVQCKNSDLIAHKLQSTLAKIIMVLDCCRKSLPKGFEMPSEQFNECISANTICQIYACASSFETFEISDGEYSFFTKALLQALNHPGRKRLQDLYKHISEYYTKYNVSASKWKPFIRPRMLYGLSADISLDDSIRPHSIARDLLLTLPKKCPLHFNHPTMKSAHQSIHLCFEAVYSNVLVFCVSCDAAKQPSLKNVKLVHNSGLLLMKLKSEGIGSYEISNLLVLMV